MYAVEWPAFAILGIAGWWGLLHAEQIDEAKREARREYEERMRAEAQIARQVDDNEDPELAAYNDHLAKLAERDAKRKPRAH
jgi:DNA-binding transcriptional regulator of glucitol operon